MTSADCLMGGGEGQIGWFSATGVVRVLEVDSLAEPNEQIDRWDLDGEDRRIGGPTPTAAKPSLGYAAEGVRCSR
ncbi:hypothetical protein OG474_29315 [Kribbella sp. NBC_01505]|uniref:hypothetical protein n=1 Tax=Kribbella sp. NBC_01505 TaxID=2903580 RepID=UPI003865B478